MRNENAVLPWKLLTAKSPADDVHADQYVVDFG